MPSICFSHKDISTIDRGGICVLFKTMMRGLVKRGWKVYCITSQDFCMKGVTVYKTKSINDPLAYSQLVTKIINKLDPDIAECSTWRYELLDFSRQKDRRAKIVIRCDPSAGTLFPLASDLDKGESELCKKADLLLTISKFAKSDIESKYGVKTHLVYNGVSKTNFNKLNYENINSGVILDLIGQSERPLIKQSVDSLINKDKINIVWIGKPTLMKGFDYLEKIVEYAGEKINFIINLGYSSNQVIWKKENMGKVTFIRGLEKSDQQLLMSKADGLLSTSRAEGFGLVISEALSLGLPVVLNSECAVFKEFSLIEAVYLVNVKDEQKTVKKLLSLKNKKVNYSRNPYKFTNKAMVEASCHYYQKIQ